MVTAARDAEGPVLPPQAAWCIARIKAFLKTLSYFQKTLTHQRWSFPTCVFSLNPANAHTVIHLCMHTAFVDSHKHTHTRGSYTQRSRHFKARRSSVRQEAAWQTPACRIKTYHPLSFSPYRRGGFCMGLAETWFWGCYLFISSVIKGSGSVTCLWWGGVQRTAIPSVMDFSTQILHRFDLWYNIEWYAAHATQ